MWRCRAGVRPARWGSEHPVWPRLSGVPLFQATCLTDWVSVSWGSLTTTHTISFPSLDSTTFNNLHRYTHQEHRLAYASPLLVLTHTHTLYVSWEPLQHIAPLIDTHTLWLIFYHRVFYLQPDPHIFPPDCHSSAATPFFLSLLKRWQQFKW